MGRAYAVLGKTAVWGTNAGRTRGGRHEDEHRPRQRRSAYRTGNEGDGANEDQLHGVSSVHSKGINLPFHPRDEVSRKGSQDNEITTSSIARTNAGAKKFCEAANMLWGDQSQLFICAI